MLLKLASSSPLGTTAIISQTKGLFLTLWDKTFDFFAEGKQGRFHGKKRVNKKDYIVSRERNILSLSSLMKSGFIDEFLQS